MTKELFFDIERGYNLDATWDKWGFSIFNIKSASILCIGYKFKGGKKQLISISDNIYRFKKDPRDDSEVIAKFIKVLNEADVVIGHNSKKFDMKHIRERAAYHGMIVGAVKQYDTYLIAKKLFKFWSNKLGDLATFLGVKAKKPSDMKWWKAVLEDHDISAMKKIDKYCLGDVDTLEGVYNRLKLFDLPAINKQIGVGKHVCPHCASLDNVKNGFAYTNVGRYQKHSCNNCGYTFRGEKI